jgi:starvation-inducible DNA-binding protein
MSSTKKLDQLPEQTKDGVRLHRTRNSQNAKGVAVALLQARLADAIDMSLITKQAHWNLKGPQFIGVHLMLDNFRKEQDEFVDTMAERITQLGGTALGTTQVVASSTKLPPYPVDIYQVSDHIHALIERYALVANAIRDNIDEVDEAGDPDTADIFTEVSRGIDKQLWFLEAHTQEQSPSASFPTKS